jgi:hypothetical protein
MILEALNYAASVPLTPAPFRPHIASSISLWARANRCRRAWAEHEARSKAHILSRIENLRQKRTAVVLGSGLLRDVPIAALCKHFDTVVLVDLVHLGHVRAGLALKGFRNTRLINRDVSGFEEALAGHMPEPLSFLRQVPYLDLVVSANLLSQITVAARHRLQTMNGRADSDSILQALVRAHLEGLAALPSATALITDVAYRVTDRAGEEQEHDDLLCGVPVPKHSASWEWTVVPFGEGRGDYQAIHQVIAD